MTTLAIIGGGIAGRTLAFTLAKEKKNYSRILFFQSESFAKACSWRSTAIVAPRGVTKGHSALGDFLMDSYECFKSHWLEDAPQGVYPIMQYTGALTKLDAFKTRYPQGEVVSEAGPLSLKSSMYLAYEKAFMIDPDIYLPWLLETAKKTAPLEVKNEFITHVENNLLKTQCGKSYKVDEIVFATGASTRFLKNLSQDKKVLSSKAVQGSYFVFSMDLGEESFSLTLEGDNLIYHAHTKKVLVGSTTQESFLEIPPTVDLRVIYQRLSELLTIKLPDFSQGEIKLGLREKASKREPYFVREKNMSFIGGLYKNGYSAGLKISRDFASHQSHGNV